MLRRSGPARGGTKGALREPGALADRSGRFPRLSGWCSAWRRPRVFSRRGAVPGSGGCRAGEPRSGHGGEELAALRTAGLLAAGRRAWRARRPCRAGSAVGALRGGDHGSSRAVARCPRSRWLSCGRTALGHGGEELAVLRTAGLLAAGRRAWRARRPCRAGSAVGALPAGTMGLLAAWRGVGARGGCRAGEPRSATVARNSPLCGPRACSRPAGEPGVLAVPCRVSGRRSARSAAARAPACGSPPCPRRSARSPGCSRAAAPGTPG